MRVVLLVVAGAIGWFVGSAVFAAGPGAQGADPFGPEGRATMAVAGIVVGLALVFKAPNSLGVLIGAALIGAGFSLWIPVDQFLDRLEPSAAIFTSSSAAV